MISTPAETFPAFSADCETLSAQGFMKPFFSAAPAQQAWAFLVPEKLTEQRHRVVLHERFWHKRTHAKLLSEAKKCCTPCQDGSICFYQIVGRTYRGETQTDMLARNVFYCLFGLQELHPAVQQSRRPLRGIKHVKLKNSHVSFCEL